MSQFSRELADIQKNMEISIDICKLLTFADYFFDDLIIDWIVQSKIVDSLEQSRQAKGLNDETIRHLENLYQATQNKLNALQEQRTQLIERT